MSSVRTALALAVLLLASACATPQQRPPCGCLPPAEDPGPATPPLTPLPTRFG